MEEDFRTVLRDDAAIMAATSGQIEFGHLPQGSTGPAIRLTTVSRPEDYYLDGPAGTKRARVQVDCFGDTYAQAKLLCRQVRSRLSGYSDARFQAMFLLSERDVSDSATDEVARWFGVQMDVEAHFYD